MIGAQLPPKPTFPPFTGLPALPALAMLQARKQWVVWDYRLNKARTKWTKPPLRAADCTNASHSEPRTWAAYDRAEYAARRNGLPGVGYVLTPDDEIGGYDLDGCRDAETGVLTPWAADVLAFGESYAEVSPSGRGVRIFALGKPEKAAKCDPAGIEVYAKERFLTVTGCHIAGTPTEIRPAPRTLAALLGRIEMTLAAIEADAAKVREAAAVKVAGERAGLGAQFKRAEGPPGVGSTSTFFRDVNSTAFANLDPWVLALFPTAKAQAGTGGYRVNSGDLGRGLEEDLSITGQGAKDFGVHDQGDAKGGSRTAIDLVMEWGGAPDAVQAALWLCARLGIDSAALGWRAGQRQSAKGQTFGTGQKTNGQTNGPAEDDGFGPKAAGAGSNGARQNGSDEPAVVRDRGLLMGAFRDRLDIALKPEKAPAFPVDALPTLMADMVGAMADLIQAPETLCAHSVLSAAVLVTQGLADIHLPNTSRAMPLSLFLLVVAASGERKSSCDGLALKAVARLESRLSETYADEMRTYRADRAAYEGEVSKIKADRKIERDERQQKLRALYEPDEPTAPIIRATEPNLEGLLNLIAKGRPSLGVFTAEGGSFLGGHGMSDDAKTRTLTGLSTLYDTGSAQRVRAKEITILDGRRVSISLAAQAKIAAALLGDELAQDQGFLGRFLVCYPDSRIGTREVRLAPTEADPRVEAFTSRIERLLYLQDGIKAPLRLPTLGLDDEAWEVFRAFSQAIEDNLGEGKHWHPIRAAAQRMAENVGRVAGVLHLFAHGGTDAPIDGDTMVAACEVGAFYLKEALRISGGVMVDAETQATDDLATWIESRSGDLIAPSIIQQNAPRPRANAAKTRERIRALCEAGRLEAIGEGEIDGKHFKEVYRVHRMVRH